jgi:hypothetical protein
MEPCVVSELPGPGIENVLLEQDWTETSIECTQTFILEDLAESTNESIGVCWIRYKTNTCRLKRAQSNISKEFRQSR